MIKVAVIIDTWFPTIGGGQTNALEVSKRLAEKGVSIDIITRNTGVEKLKLPSNLKVIKLGKRTNPFNYFSKIFFLLKAYTYVAKHNYDLVHAHAFLPGITAKLLSVLNGIPSIFSVHGTSIGTKHNNVIRQWIEKFILTRISYSAQITVSRDFQKIKNVNKKVYYIPNGVEVSNFSKVKVSKSNDQTLLFVGRLNWEKNLINLVKSMPYLLNQLPNVKLLIVGNGKEEKKLKSLSNKLHLKNHVSFLGWVSGLRLIKLYKSSDIFIIPSIYEGQPLTLLESWSAKIPVIATKTGDNKFLVKDGINGYLINNPQDPKDIAETIIKAFKKNDFVKLGENGYRLVKKSFSWSNAATKTLKVYKQCIHG